MYCSGTAAMGFISSSPDSLVAYRIDVHSFSIDNLYSFSTGNSSMLDMNTVPARCSYLGFCSIHPDIEYG